MAAKPSLFAILLRALGQVTFALAHGSFGRVCAGAGAFLPISGWGARREPGRGRFGRIPPLFFPEKNAEKGWEGREGREIFFKNLFLKKPPLFRTLQITIHSTEAFVQYSSASLAREPKLQNYGKSFPRVT